MTDPIHACREAAQMALEIDGVQASDVIADPGTDAPVVEIVVANNRIEPSLLQLLADAGLAIDPDATDTRGNPTHTVVVARR